jgi:hypothetical protein
LEIRIFFPGKATHLSFAGLREKFQNRFGCAFSNFALCSRAMPVFFISPGTVGEPYGVPCGNARID